MILRTALVAAAALAALTAGTASAQPDSLAGLGPVIVVSGSGEASRTADWFDVSISLAGRGATQLQALEALARAQTAVRDGVARLEGAQRLEARTGSAGVQETFTVECERDRDDERTATVGECAPSGFSATSTSTFRIRPVTRAGDVVSMAAQQGALTVRTEDAGVDDRAALRQAAVEAAVRSARQQAEAVARGSGLTLGPLLRVVDSNARGALEGDQSVGEVVVTGSRIRPAVSLTIEPPPVTESATVSVIFGLAR